ncbi:glycoside hydrolase family 88 protein [Carboxylicivirga sp. A043]|uniref:DUF4995 domain-containing protein n=1 Tax=Carboxylicivirga litoralis TaxID=2816963 RepID=UPI0021CB5CC0|nr:DUF4995 domain-containing protein [Carboxylicivirga sp. A043]MCU4157738.1 glycoside hydrolase family 88 protein [Carboxylicivirga sp. A043]
MKQLFILFAAIILIVLQSCCNTDKAFIEDNVQFAEQQLNNAVNAIEKDGKFPRSIKKDRTVGFVGAYDWTSGFFPGSLWYLYELSGNEQWKQEAQRTTHWLEKIQHFTGNHDIGFMLSCSYGNGFRLTNNPDYQTILINGAESLSTRYDSITKVIRSWDFKGGTKDGHVWQYPVIIDNMMNLELLFLASDFSGNEKYRNIAIQHANTTIKNHFRDDFSTYHVVDYDTISGAIRGRYTHQGLSHESSWARGQAWGLYGYTMCARETGDASFLQQAEHIADYIMHHPNLPADKVPLWDYHAKDTTFYPTWIEKLPPLTEAWRDASAATITCAALFDLSQLSETKGADYYQFAERLLHNLSQHYRSTSNKYFVLEHSVGNLPSNSEVDVPINYADYYYLEALVKFKNLTSSK